MCPSEEPGTRNQGPDPLVGAHDIAALRKWQEILVQGIDKFNITINNLNVELDMREGRVNYLDGRDPVGQGRGAG
jgi:hypothetical protein